MTSLYEVLKAQKMGAAIAPDYFTALWAGATGGGEQWEVIEYTGAVPVEIYANGEPLIELLISGNMQQTGTPSPQSIIMPDETGERTGNLLDYTTVEGTSYTTVTQISGGISVSGQYYVKFRTVQFEVGKSYTMSWKANTISGTSARSWRFHYADNTYSSMPSSGGSLVAEKEVTELLLYVSTGASCVVEFTEIMLNSGSTALPYEPYGYKLDISSGGENLFDKDKQAGTIYVTETVTRYGVEIPVDAGIYTIASGTNILFAKEKYGTTYGIAVDTSVPRTITLPQDGYILIYASNEAHYTVSNIMLNLGSTAKPYSPYNRTTTPVYLGEVETERQVRKLVLDGTEPESILKMQSANIFYVKTPREYDYQSGRCISTHYKNRQVVNSDMIVGDIKQDITSAFGTTGGVIVIKDICSSLDDFKAYLAQQYANGTPVTVWYVLATPTTGIVNEPLRKIGNYADTLSVPQTIPTVEGENVVDVETTLKPSEIYLKYKGRSNT